MTAFQFFLSFSTQFIEFSDFDLSMESLFQAIKTNSPFDIRKHFNALKSREYFHRLNYTKENKI